MSRIISLASLAAVLSLAGACGQSNSKGSTLKDSTATPAADAPSIASQASKALLGKWLGKTGDCENSVQVEAGSKPDTITWSHSQAQCGNAIFNSHTFTDFELKNFEQKTYAETDYFREIQANGFTDAGYDGKLTAISISGASGDSMALGTGTWESNHGTIATKMQVVILTKQPQ
jgi:hypothetical protein